MFCGPETASVSREESEGNIHGRRSMHKPFCFPRVTVNKYFIMTGLKITADMPTVKMTGQLDFSSVKICS